jgi:peptidoglycan/xylan/chitin deacetylase (PgdA/CDA1 family)
VLVLLYHRVIELEFDPHRLCVTPSHFGEHLEVLRAYGRRYRIREVAAALRAGRLPHRGVGVTFDDGYADNLHNAKPLLERHDVPATVFVTAGYVGRGREFWWDELERIVFVPAALPPNLALTVNDRHHEWPLGVAASNGGYHGWDMARKESADSRGALYRTLYTLLCPLADERREEALAALRAWAGLPADPRPTHRTLDVKEVVQLADGGLIEIGAHTATHPILGSLDRRSQWNEVHGGKTRLEQMLGRRVTSFAYPYGSRARSDYTEETVGVVRDAGFECACSYRPEPVRRHADPFQISRATVLDWNGDEFERRLRQWFNG